MRRVLILATVLLTIPGCLGSVGYAIDLIPGIGFWKGVLIRNESNEPFRATVMSNTFNKWYVQTLMTDTKRARAFNSFDEFEIQPGQAREFYYEDDDGFADALLIVRQGGERVYFLQETDSAGGPNCVFHVNSLDQLPPPPPDVVAATKVSAPLSLVLLRYLLFAAPPVWILCLLLLWFTKPEKNLFVQ